MTTQNTYADKADDSASVEMLEKASLDCIETCFDRYDTQKNHCKFGKEGTCCKICYMGPCRITPKSPKGVCGADADTIAARNFLREVTGGTASHSDHGRHLAILLQEIAHGKELGYKVKDPQAVFEIAKLYGIETEDREMLDVIRELADIFIGDFTSQEETIKTVDLAPQKTRTTWSNLGILPQGIDRMCVEAMHRTHMGVDHDYKNLIMHAFRQSISNGWGGSRIASMASDILFGTPRALRTEVNLGVLKENNVNILVHGHEPTLSDMIAIAVKDPEIEEYAKSAGAEGVTVGGICCTANEILMRHGIPIAGNFLQQELALVTGAVEMMIVDVQCIMPSLPLIAENYHTKIVGTTPMAKTIGAEFFEFSEARALDCAKELLKKAIDNFKNRDKARVKIPAKKETVIAGFSVREIKYMLGGSFRASFRPLNDAIIQNRIKGVVGIVGCNNPKFKTDWYCNELVKELLKNNVLIVETGCSAIASGKDGKLTPETALEYAGFGLKEVCETVGIPPVLHMGSCVDNTRILEACTEIVKEGGLGDSIAGLPAAGVCPELMSEKAVSISCYCVATGIDVFIGHPFHITGSENVYKFLTEDVKEMFNASMHFVENPTEAAKQIVAVLDEKREKLGINKKYERKLLDQKDRREVA
ncbi:MAG: anaerobic carbon-monoxide dehydrogenase catalytic subunit [Synergistaceae bacterium]|jgi:carbon-monoxide dehydrogenase catalytic subunit|nr:anaerobic carbon-monoxide dehydrogenase catalytic subunit [Synergistaceae bacterium]